MGDDRLFVLDACALIAFLRQEDGADVVADVLQGQGNRCLAHAINLCEVYYDMVRRTDEATAAQILADVEDVGVEPYLSVELALWQRAGRLKADVRRISLADCFALALADLHGGTLLTSDRHEFGPLAASGAFRIQFIR